MGIDNLAARKSALGNPKVAGYSLAQRVGLTVP